MYISKETVDCGTSGTAVPFIYKMADGARSNCVGDGEKVQSNADIENLTQYVSKRHEVVL